MNEMPMGGDAAHLWVVAPAAFIGMWVAMMVPMMLPSLIPMLRRYRHATTVVTGDARLSPAVALVSLGYFFVWTVLGAAAFPLSIALARLPHIATGVIVAIAGAWQFTALKTEHLACCRQATPRNATLRGAWRHGMRLGLDCARSCGNLMIIPLVLGMMDLRAMALVGIAITLERVAPASERVARAVGVATMVAGAFLIFNAAVV